MQQQQRESTVTLPGSTNAVITMRVAPLAIHCLHLRQRAWLVGATPIRYVEGRALKPISQACVSSACSTLERRWRGVQGCLAPSGAACRRQAGSGTGRGGGAAPRPSAGVASAVRALPRGAVARGEQAAPLQRDAARVCPGAGPGSAAAARCGTRPAGASRGSERYEQRGAAEQSAASVAERSVRMQRACGRRRLAGASTHT